MTPIAGLFFVAVAGHSMPNATSQVTKSEQGELQGNIGSLLGLSSIIAPALFTLVFSRFSADENSVFYFPGATEGRIDLNKN